MLSSVEIIIFWILLLDSLIANLIAWFGTEWYIKHCRTLSRLLPVTKAWAGYYLVLILWVGSILYRFAF